MNIRPIDPVADRALRDLPEGMLEREAEVAIRNLRRVHGYDGMREIVAKLINEEADRRPHNG